MGCNQPTAASLRMFWGFQSWLRPLLHLPFLQDSPSCLQGKRMDERGGLEYDDETRA
jgi:hypothetical protein